MEQAQVEAQAKAVRGATRVCCRALMQCRAQQMRPSRSRSSRTVVRSSSTTDAVALGADGLPECVELRITAELSVLCFWREVHAAGEVWELR